MGVSTRDGSRINREVAKDLYLKDEKKVVPVIVDPRSVKSHH